MIAGATYTLPVDVRYDLTGTDKVIVTLKNPTTGATRQKHYPDDEQTYLMDDGRIGVKLSQRDTTELRGRVLVEAQINLGSGAVAKTLTAETYIAETLYTEYVDGAEDDGITEIDGVVLEIGAPIIQISGTATDSNAVHYYDEKKTDEQRAQARANIGALGSDELTGAVEDALAQAKASGEFDGAKGDKGDPGDDYILTDEDKNAIAEEAAGKLQPRIDEISEAIDNKLDKSGGTLSGKIVLPSGNENAGFTNSADVKIIGYGGGNFRVGDINFPVQLRGSTERPKYNDGELVLKTEFDTALGSYITDIDALIGGDA